ncbi:MAG: FeoA family protein [Lawsonella clevelandensis]
MSDSPCLLSDLKPGDSATIVSIANDAPDSIRRRLSDLGFAPGTAITMTRRAPMGDPACSAFATTTSASARAKPNNSTSPP